MLTATVSQNSTSNVKSFSMPAILLRVEGAAVFATAIALYASRGESWWVFIALLLTPDLGMLSYFISPRWGSIGYNLVHTYTLPILLAVLSLAGQWPLGIHLALIWFAHIGMDRLVGYGLKYTTAFKDTHLQRV